MKERIMFVGLDVHVKTIRVAVKIGGGREYLEWNVGNTAENLRKLAVKLCKVAEGREVRCCYEAGPLGYVPKRILERAAPLVCEVAAPNLIPVVPGQKVKTDRRDARKLADMLAANLLEEVHAPTEEEEAVRDLCRCRWSLTSDLHRARQRVSSFLLRRGIRYDRGTTWTKVHMRWLNRLKFEIEADQVTFWEYYSRVQHLMERLKYIEEKLEQEASREPFKKPVKWLGCFQGIGELTALCILAEVHDFRRFQKSQALMSYLGLTPGESSSGEKQCKGGITKTGQKAIRRLLIEAAHHYRHRPQVGFRLKKRRKGQAVDAIAVANLAHQRLHRKYWRLIHKGKAHNKAVTAVARELVGFIWGSMQQYAQAA